MSLTVAFPNDSMRMRFAGFSDRAHLIVWRPGDEVGERINYLVIDHREPIASLARIPPGVVDIVQIDSLGFDGAEQVLPPGTILCNGAGIHEAPTAELAITLTLASQRGWPDLADFQQKRIWASGLTFPGLAGRRVLLIGVGGVGARIARLLEPFDVHLERVGRSARVDLHGQVFALSDLPPLLLHSEIVILALPLTNETRGIMSAELLGRLPRGALIVNVSRGGLIDTEALTERVRKGELRCALDVVDPEPLPIAHPLWSLPGSLISPHLGGRVSGTESESERLVRAQIERLMRLTPPDHIVIST